MRVLTTIALIVGLTASAHAEEAPQKTRIGAVSLSPLHLTIGVVELQAEVTLTPVMSVAMIVGTGEIPPAWTEKFVPELSEDVSVTEYRVQFRYYYTGTSAGGAYFGLQGLHLELETQSQNVDVDGSGPGYGAFAGYKWDWSGFVLDVHVGAVRMNMEGAAEGEVGNTDVDAKGSKSFIMPTINANIGWGF